MFRLPLFVFLLSGLLIAAVPAGAAPIGHAAVDFVDLGAYLAHDDVLLVFAPTSTDPNYTRQHDALAGQEPGFAARGLIVGMLTDDAGGTVDDVTATPGAVMVLRAQLSVPDRQFTAVLIGKDGGVKLQQHRPVSADALFALIDAMPASQQEIPQQ